MDVKAIAKDVRISPIKLRLIVDLIRGKDVQEALNILTNYKVSLSSVELTCLCSTHIVLSICVKAQNNINFLY